MRRILLTFILLAAAQPCFAVIVAGGDGTQNTSAPADDFGFADLGTTGYGTVVYLGNGWVLSAYHLVCDNSRTGFSFGSVSLDGANYNVLPASAVRLLNPDSSAADLALFRLDSIPVGLTGVTLANNTPSPFSSVTMAGDGYDRQPTETHWNSDWTTTTGRRCLPGLPLGKHAFAALGYESDLRFQGRASHAVFR